MGTAIQTKTIFAALEEGEDQSSDDYQRDLHKLDAIGRRLIESRILSEQLHTHDMLSTLVRENF